MDTESTHVTDVRERGTGLPPVRQRSGLVRGAGPYDAFVFALATTSVGIMVSWGQFFGTGFYPGANIVLSLTIATVAALFIAWAYQYWGQVFPRSGGDYVFLTRGLNPGLGLGLNVVFVVMVVSAPAFAMSILQPLAASFAAALAEATGWGFLNDVSTWIATTSWGFAVTGLVPVAVAGLVGIYGLKGQLRLLKWLFLAGTIGTVILVVALIFSSTPTFLAHLQQTTGLTAREIGDTAGQSGFAFGGFDLKETMKLSNWFAASLFFTLVLVYIGGEIKEVRKSLRWGMLGAVVFASAATALFMAALTSVVPLRLQGALAFNSFVVPEASTPGVAYPHELLRVLWGTSGFGLVLTLVSYVTFLAWTTIWTASVVPVAQRAILAWSLDGVIPRVFSNVYSKRHAPIPALIASCAITGAWIVAFAFNASWRTIILLIPQYVLIGVTLAVGVFFPFTRKELYRQSIIADETTAGIPRMTLACTLATAVLVVWTWLLWIDPVAAGTSKRPLWTVLGIALAVAVYYFILRAYRKSQGEDIDVTFKQIPVE